MPQRRDVARYSAQSATGPVVRNTVVRQAVQAELDRLASHPVTLVCAPAGYGKSLAVATWLASRELSAGWVHLSEARDRPSTMWKAIIGALGRASNDLRDALGGIDDAVGLGTADVPARVAAALHAASSPVVLVLDDIHGITSLVSHEQLLELIALAGPDLRVIAISRHDPPWPIDRMRLDGTLGEIRADALRFDDAEAAEMMTELGIDVPADDVAALVERTQGWAAGLRLAAFGLDGAEDPHEYIKELSGHSGYIADYLRREVVADLDPSTREVLRRMSMLEESCPALITALGAGDDSAETLAALADTNAFVQEIGGHPGWFRLHPLLADYLQYGVIDRPEILELNRRASRWYAGQGDPWMALRYALAGEEWETAGDYLGRYVVSWVVCGDPNEVAALLAPIPRETILSHVGLAIGTAATQSITARRDGIDETMARARSLLDADPDHPARLDVVLNVIDFGILRRRGDLTALLDTCRKVPTDLETLADLEIEDWTAIRTLVFGNRGTAELWLGDWVSAEANLTFAAIPGSRAVLPALNARAQLALLQWATGSLCAATASAESALTEFTGAGIEQEVVQVTGVYLALAGCALDRDDLTETQRWLDAADRVIHEPHARLGAAMLRARLLTATDRAAEARTLLEAAVVEASSSPLSPALRADARRTLAFVRRRAGMAAPAQGSVVEPVSMLWWSPSRERGTTIRGTLDQHLRHACNTQVDDDARLDALERALRVASGEDLRRDILDNSDVLRPLLSLRLERGTAEAAFATDLLIRMGAGAAGAAHGRRTVAVPLSPRELSVLPYLAGSMTTAEIGAALYISVNTVKSHQRAIYQKLGVTGRRAAVARARELGLL